MIISTNALKKALNTMFHKAYGELLKNQGSVSNELMSVAMELKSTGRSETHSWFGDIPIVKELIDEKTFGALKQYKYTITNRTFYTGIKIHKNELADDQYGMFQPRINMMGPVLQKKKRQLVSDLIKDGDIGEAYDEFPFFSNATGKRLNDNLLAGTGIAIDKIEDDIATARAAMMTFVSDTGEIMELIMDTIVCPPLLERVMLKAVRSATIYTSDVGANVYNPVSQWIKKVIVDPRLTDANDWYGMATGWPVKPFIYQNRQNPETMLDDKNLISKGWYEYSAEIRGDAGYGLPILALKVVNA